MVCEMKCQSTELISPQLESSPELRHKRVGHKLAAHLLQLSTLHFVNMSINVNFFMILLICKYVLTSKLQLVDSLLQENVLLLISLL